MKEYTIGSYVSNGWQITEEIGSGANGTVYKIEKNVGSVKTVSALKVIRIPQSESAVRQAYSEGMDEVSITSYFQGFVDEILKEAALMNQLKNHPNIVGYEDTEIIKHEDGIGWDILIRMELLTPLDMYLLHHDMDEREAVQMGLDLTNALDHCHRQGIIHRDIKPANIFVTEKGVFKLGDFGIARTIEKTTGGLSKKGTESYMAPEVYLVRPYNESVDQYSLGMVLYSCMNKNRLPFLPPYPQPITFSQREEALAGRMRGEEIPKPSQASEKFSQIILKACSYDPKRRYKDAEEFHNALDALIPKRVEETPPPIPKRKFDFKSMPIWAWYVAAGIVCIIGFLGVRGIGGSTPSSSPETVIEETVKSDEEYQKEFEAVIKPFMEEMSYVNGMNWETASLEEIGKSLEGDFTFLDENGNNVDTYTYSTFYGSTAQFRSFDADEINYVYSIHCTEIGLFDWVLKANDEPAENRDKIVISYVGKKDGTEIDGDTGDQSDELIGSTDVLIGSGSFPEEFEQQLIGMKTGEEKEIEYTFPEDYHIDDFAGRKFTVTVKEVYSMPNNIQFVMDSIDWNLYDSLKKKTMLNNDYFPDVGFKLGDSKEDVLKAIGITPDMMEWLSKKGNNDSWTNNDYWSVSVDHPFEETRISIHYSEDYQNNDDQKNIYLWFNKEDDSLYRVSYSMR